MVSIDDVVVPVSASELEGMSTLEAEGSLPRAGLGGRILGGSQGKLGLVAIPRTDKVDSSDIGGGSEGEAQLNGWGRHVVRDFWSCIEKFWKKKSLILIWLDRLCGLLKSGVVV